MSPSETSDQARRYDLTDPSTTSYTLQDLAAGTWYFAVSAYTTGGLESSLSNVVSTTID